MTLRITRASDPIEVKSLTACLYSAPGLGKTTLGFTAHAPLLIDFDRGAYRAALRGDSVQPATWGDVASITQADLAPYRTVVIDTAGRALDLLTADIIAGNPKLGRGGALTLQGFGELKARFIAWTKLLRSHQLDVVLIAHSSEERSGDDLYERLDVQGGSKGEIYKAADLMGRLYLAGGRRTLNFSPTDTAFGKNPANLDPLSVPPFATSPHFLGEVLDTVKAALNRFSGEQVRAASLLADWKARIEEAGDAEDLAELVPEVEKSDELVRANVRRLLKHAARDKGLAWDTDAKCFAPLPKHEPKQQTLVT